MVHIHMHTYLLIYSHFYMCIEAFRSVKSSMRHQVTSHQLVFAPKIRQKKKNKKKNIYIYICMSRFMDNYFYIDTLLYTNYSKKRWILSLHVYIYIYTTYPLRPLCGTYTSYAPLCLVEPEIPPRLNKLKSCTSLTSSTSHLLIERHNKNV